MNFDLIPIDGVIWEIHHDGDFPSHAELDAVVATARRFSSGSVFGYFAEAVIDGRRIEATTYSNPRKGTA